MIFSSSALIWMYHYLDDDDDDDTAERPDETQRSRSNHFTIKSTYKYPYNLPSMTSHRPIQSNVDMQF